MTWRVMIVDDEPDVRAIVSASLKGNYEIVEAHDGLDALEKLDRYEPDFVIIDVMMPLMNGYDACAAIRRHPKFLDIPVMFLSALGEKEAMLKGYKSGANLYMTKPFDSERLLRNVEVFFEKNPPPIYTKKITIEEIEEIEKDKVESSFDIDNINDADTIFDYTIPKAAVEWRKKNKDARQPVELSEDLEISHDEMKSLKEKWKSDLERKNAWAYSSRPQPRQIQTPQIPEVKPEKTKQAKPAAKEKVTAQSPLSAKWETPETKSPAVKESANKKQISLEGIPRIVPAHPIPQKTRKIIDKSEAGDHVLTGKSSKPARTRIMVIDDDPDIVELVRLTLSDEFDVVWALNGLTGIEKLVAWEPDLLLLDIMLPNMSGYQILQSLRSNKSLQNLLVIMISAKGSARDRDYAYRMGANSYVVKPFAPSSLHDLIRKYTHRRAFNVRPKKFDIKQIRSELEPLPHESKDVFWGAEEQRVLKSFVAGPEKKESAYSKTLQQMQMREEEVIQEMEQQIKSQKGKGKNKSKKKRSSKK